jgi:hypothetical protein
MSEASPVSSILPFPDFQTRLLRTVKSAFFVKISQCPQLIRMPQQRGVAVKAVNAPWEIVSDIDIPEPSSTQILLKSIWTAVNPV